MYTITNEYDKIRLLEKLLCNNSKLETIVSNYIDFTITNKQNEASNHAALIKELVPDNYQNIIDIATCIANQKPFTIILNEYTTN